jgi:hypothetical protein
MFKQEKKWMTLMVFGILSGVLLLAGCPSADEVPIPPSVTNPVVVSKGTDSAVLGGTVSDTGGANIVERGIYWSTASDFASTAQGATISQTGNWATGGAFTVSAMILPTDTTIYFKAYAVNSAGTAFSNVATFTLGTDTTPLSVTTVEESITTNTTWLTDHVYYINKAISIEDGASLTLPAGCIVKFGTSGSLRVYSGGTVEANGTADKPVVFTSIRDNSALAGGDTFPNDAGNPAAGDWNYIWVYSGSNSNKFVHCIFRYAGKDLESTLYLDGQALVDHCTFHDNASGTISSGYVVLDARNTVTGTNGTTITNNLFYNNTWPLAIPVNMSLDNSNRFTFDHDNNSATPALGNTYQAIWAEGSTIEGTINWAETEVPLCLTGRVYVDPIGTLTVENNVAVKFASTSAGIFVEDGGTFNDNGGFFTSWKDDAVKGDSNANGSANSPAAGDWEGIYFYSTSQYISDARITYAENP